MASPHYGVREQDQYMPIANVIRIMRRILPSHAKISDDAKETIQECVSEYISFITAEANDRCQREQRKTVTAEDVLWAMGKLGFDDYVGPLTLYLQRYRESEGEPAAVRRSVSVASYGSALGMPSSHSLPPPQPAAPSSYGSGFPPIAGMFDPSGMAGFYRDDGSGAAGGSGSGCCIAGFDPFAHLKRDRI